MSEITLTRAEYDEISLRSFLLGVIMSMDNDYEMGKIAGELKSAIMPKVEDDF